VEVVASLSQGRTAAAQCGLFTHKSVPVIFGPPCMLPFFGLLGWQHCQFRRLSSYFYTLENYLLRIAYGS